MFCLCCCSPMRKPRRILNNINKAEELLWTRKKQNCALLIRKIAIKCLLEKQPQKAFFHWRFTRLQRKDTAEKLLDSKKKKTFCLHCIVYGWESHQNVDKKELYPIKCQTVLWRMVALMLAMQFMRNYESTLCLKWFDSKAAWKPHSQFHAAHPDHFQQAKPPLLVTAKADRTKNHYKKTITGQAFAGCGRIFCCVWVDNIGLCAYSSRLSLLRQSKLL